MRRLAWMTCDRHRETAWKRCPETVPGSTAFASTTSGRCVSFGWDGDADHVEIVDYH